MRNYNLIKVSIHKQAKKILDNLQKSEKEKIKFKLKQLCEFIEGSSESQSFSLDIKALKGKLKPLKRLKVGKYRVIFNYESGELTLYIISISHRRNAYKD